MIIEILLFIVAGSLAGLLAGLLGIGGGLLVVPFLAFYLPFIGVKSQYVMHISVATSLAIIVFTSMASVYGHYRHGQILWGTSRQLLAGLILGAISGAIIADFLPSNILRIMFGVFVLIIAYRMMLAKKEVRHSGLPGTKGLIAAGFGIAGFCTLLGTGGGSLMVPFLARCNVPLRRAVATSAVCGFPIALTGVVSLILTGQDVGDLPAWSAGYVYWPAFLGLVIPSMLCAPLGAKLTQVVPVAILRKFFAVFLLLVGIDMLSKAFL